MTEVELDAKLPTPLDVLVVLDDTPAMASHLPRVPPPTNLAGVLVGIYNGAPDLRIAVTTSTTGTLRTTSAIPDGILVHRVRMEDGVLTKNYQGDLAAALGTLMNVGAESTAPNAPFTAIASAIATPAFVREGSGVGILLASASDDASPDSPSAHAAAIQEVHDNSMLVSAIYDEPATRLAAFLDGFAKRRVTPLGAYNMEAVSIFAQLFAQRSTDFCFPVAPTFGSDCVLFTAHEQNANPLPPCRGDAFSSTDACFEIISEPSCSSGRGIVFGGPYSQYHPQIFGRCPTN